MKTTSLKGIAVVLVTASSIIQTALAIDHSLGFESKGKISVNLTIPEQVKISNTNDFVFNTRTGKGGLKSTDEICIYLRGSRLFDIRALGTGKNDEFVLYNGSNTLNYNVIFDDGNGPTPLSAGVRSSHQARNARSINCQSGGQSKLQINLSESEMENATAGNYVGTLTLMVAPH